MRDRGIMAAGAGLLWRRQRVLWWVFGVNLVIGLLATAPVRSQLRILDSSAAAAQSLYQELNLFRLDEALSRPEGLSAAFYSGSALLAFAFYVFLVFAMGGVLESLSLDRTLRFGEFLRSSAENFWRMVRLVIVFGIALIPIVAAHEGIQSLLDWIGEHSSRERLGFFVVLALHLALGLAALAIRVWFDVAQVDIVAQDQSAVRRSLRRTWRLLAGNFWRVYGAVIAVQVLLLATTFLLLALWVKLPHEAIGTTFLMGEVIVLLWLGFRFWQKAIECVWYERRLSAESVMIAEAIPVEIPIDVPAAAPSLPPQ